MINTACTPAYAIYLLREQDAMMVYSNGAWVQLRNLIEPAVAEARARKEMLSRRRRANQHLFDREARHDSSLELLFAAA